MNHLIRRIHPFVMCENRSSVKKTATEVSMMRGILVWECPSIRLNNAIMHSHTPKNFFRKYVFISQSICFFILGF